MPGDKGEGCHGSYPSQIKKSICCEHQYAVRAVSAMAILTGDISNYPCLNAVRAVSAMAILTADISNYPCLNAASTFDDYPTSCRQ